MYSTYRLIDPRDGSTFYVGLTTDVYARFLEHIQCSGNNFAKNARIVELRTVNKMVIMETLQEAETRTEGQEQETYWIKHFTMLGEPLLNISQMSSVRRAKKTNLRIGRKIGQEVAAYVQKVAQPKQSFQDERQQIIRLAKSGMPRRNICSALGKGKYYYDVVKQVLDEEGL